MDIRRGGMTAIAGGETEDRIFSDRFEDAGHDGPALARRILDRLSYGATTSEIEDFLALGSTPGSSEQRRFFGLISCTFL